MLWNSLHIVLPSGHRQRQILWSSFAVLACDPRLWYSDAGTLLLILWANASASLVDGFGVAKWWPGMQRNAHFYIWKDEKASPESPADTGSAQLIRHSWDPHQQLGAPGTHCQQVFAVIKPDGL